MGPYSYAARGVYTYIDGETIAKYYDVEGNEIERPAA